MTNEREDANEAERVRKMLETRKANEEARKRDLEKLKDYPKKK